MRYLNVFNPLYLEVLLTLILARILILSFSFRKLAASMAKPIKMNSKAQKSQSNEAAKISHIVKSLSKRVPFRSACFEQALAMQMLLKRRGVASTITFGLHSENDTLAAHAWCECFGITLTGNKGKEQFTEIKRFSNQQSFLS